MADELVTWGLLEARRRDGAGAPTASKSSEIERNMLLLESPFVRLGPPTRGRDAKRDRRSATTSAGCPATPSSGDGGSAPAFSTRRSRALSNLGESRPTPEAQARLLGLGTRRRRSGFADQPPWLDGPAAQAGDGALRRLPDGQRRLRAGLGVGPTRDSPAARPARSGSAASWCSPRRPRPCATCGDGAIERRPARDSRAPGLAQLSRVSLLFRVPDLRSCPTAWVRGLILPEMSADVAD